MPSYRQLINLIKTHTHKIFLEYWDKMPCCLQAKEMLPYPSQNRARYFSQMSRTNLRQITGILTGHCKLQKHLYMMKLTDSPICRACEHEDETAKHILCDCTSLEDLRADTLGEPRPTPEDIRSTPLARVLAFTTALGWLA